MAIQAEQTRIELPEASSELPRWDIDTMLQRGGFVLVPFAPPPFVKEVTATVARREPPTPEKFSQEAEYIPFADDTQAATVERAFGEDFIAKGDLLIASLTRVFAAKASDLTIHTLNLDRRALDLRNSTGHPACMVYYLPSLLRRDGEKIVDSRGREIPESSLFMSLLERIATRPEAIQVPIIVPVGESKQSEKEEEPIPATLILLNPNEAERIIPPERYIETSYRYKSQQGTVKVLHTDGRIFKVEDEWTDTRGVTNSALHAWYIRRDGTGYFSSARISPVVIGDRQLLQLLGRPFYLTADRRQLIHIEDGKEVDRFRLDPQ